MRIGNGKSRVGIDRGVMDLQDESKLKQVRKLDSIFERLFRLKRAKADVNRLGLTATQLFVMHYLSYEKDVKASDIARVAGLSPGAITQVCDELVRLDYVERMRSKEDRRVVLVKLTDAGSEQIKTLLAQRTARLADLLDKLGEHDANQLIALLERLVTIAQEDSLT